MRPLSPSPAGSAPRALGRLAGYAALHPGLAAASLFCLLAGTALAMAGPLLMRRVIDGGITARTPGLVALFALAYLVAELARTGVEMAQGYLLRLYAHRTSSGLRRDLFARLRELPLSWFDATPPGEVASRALGDTSAVGEALSAGLVGLARDCLVLLGVGTIAILLEPHFGGLVLASSLLVGVPSLLFGRSSRERARSAHEASSRMSAVMEENIAGRTVIRLFGAESFRAGRFRTESEGALGVALSSLRARVVLDAGASVTAALALTVMIGAGGRELSAGRITGGLLVAFVQYGSFLLGAMRGVAEKAVSVSSGLAAGERIFELLERPSEWGTAPGVTGGGRPASGLALEDVHFSYLPGREVLKGLSVVIRSGERVALVGRTGAGKTTIARLMARLYDPTAGALRLDGKDLRELPRPELRRRIAFVTQKVSLFGESILENIRLGEAGIGRAEVMAACREVGAHTFIEKLPGSYDCPVGEGGTELSVGERQLLAFARILVRNPELVILDEPTAHVDPATERLILAAVGKILAGRTCVIIAHRYSTLRGVGRALVIDQGKIVRDEPEPLRLLGSPGDAGGRTSPEASRGSLDVERMSDHGQ